MQKVLLITGSSRCVSELRENTDVEETAESAAEVMELLKSGREFSVIIADHPSALEGMRELLDYIDQMNNYIFSTAVLILTDESSIEKDSLFLGGAVIDCIGKPYHPAVIQNRLRNAERLINSVSFSEFADMLKVLPASIYLKDANGKYVFSSQTWHHLETSGDPSWTIRGKTDLEIRKDKENAVLAMESDKKIIRSGKGVSYVIEENDGSKEYLQIIKEPLFFKDGRVRGIIALINNVTEQETLRRQLREQSIHDTLTGLYNRCYLDEYINELTECRQYPIGIISADCDGLKHINDTFGHMAGDRYICLCTEVMRKTLPGRSCIFRTGGDEFIAFIPGASAEELSSLIGKMNMDAASHSVNNVPLSISFGYYIVPNETESIITSMKISDNEMYREKRNKKSRR